ncbi:hypothetical protein AVEN_253540-1 [Araneus ventricosus]|uniref:Uncharacterized protein n=1 Tax=Araneus ventricosus TaxID=182803 RepID=A0A4Y2BTF1_ARAVE|nr:hypothetical protein AVEN_253540-1 [Araneus ventricosus]
MEQSSENLKFIFEIISSFFRFYSYEDVNLSQNIVINFSFSGHMSVNSPVPGTSTSETTISPEVVKRYPKALFRIMKRFRKRAESANLTSIPEKQKIEEELLKISRKEKIKKNKDYNLNFLVNY